MTTLFHIIHQASWTEIEKHSKKKNLLEFRELYTRLRMRNPVPNTESIVVSFTPKGKCTTTSNGKECTTTESLLNQWLGYVIDAPPTWTDEQAIAAIFEKISKDKVELIERSKAVLAEFIKFN